MRIRIFFFGLAVALVGVGQMPIAAQISAGQDEDVRGAFLTTRPKSAEKPKSSGGPYKKPSRRRPKVVAANSGNVAKTSDAKAASPIAKTPIAQRMGLGLTLFMRNANGLAVRADPTREFGKGDHVRLLLESNVDGYLYVFNTTDNGAPVMIYPDPDLDEAGNYIQSHVPFEIPSSVAPEERLRWFTFDAVPGIEKLHFVFSREPLTGVPIEDDLIAYCQADKTKCPWNPGAEVWANIQKEMSSTTLLDKPRQVGKAETDVERLAVTRGIGLNRDDAEPSLIMLNAATNKAILVATLELVHKAVSYLPDDEGNTLGVEFEVPQER